MARRFARNTGDRAELRKNARQRAERAAASTQRQRERQSLTRGRSRAPVAGVSTQRMMGIDGKQHTYHVQTDSRGRRRIIDTGIAAPKDYYNASGKKYYLKKAYARLSENAPQAQKDWLRGRAGKFFEKYLDSTSRQGMNAYEKGKGIMANMRKTTAAKREMDAYEAYSDYDYGRAGGRSRKASRYTVLFGQDGHCQ